MRTNASSIKVFEGEDYETNIKYCSVFSILYVCILELFPVVVGNYRSGLAGGVVFPSILGVAALTLMVALLCSMWDLTKCPSAKADRIESSPARTAPQVIMASSLAFLPGSSGQESLIHGSEEQESLIPGSSEALIPSISRAADWAGRTVPPPTVPTSIEGMVHEMCKLGPSALVKVMQLELQTF